MMLFLELLFWVVFFLLVGPWLLITGLVMGAVIIPLIPIVLIIVILWLGHRRRKIDKAKPEIRKPYVYKPKKQIMVTIQGRQMGLLAGVLLITAVIITVPILILLMLFVIPPIITIPIVCIYIGYSLRKK